MIFDFHKFFDYNDLTILNDYTRFNISTFDVSKTHCFACDIEVRYRNSEIVQPNGKQRCWLREYKKRLSTNRTVRS